MFSQEDLWLSPDTLVSKTNTDCHNITYILLKVILNNNNPSITVPKAFKFYTNQVTIFYILEIKKENYIQNKLSSLHPRENLTDIPTCIAIPRSSHQEGRVGIPLISLTPTHFCACPKPGFSTSYVVVSLFLYSKFSKDER
jgi:hypothetical protein